MKKQAPLLMSVFATALLVGGAALAQDTMPAQTAPTDQSSMPANPNHAPTGSASYNTTQGELTVKSSTSRTPSVGTPPSFEQLSGGKGAITKDEAAAYPPLANDFLYASHGGNTISKKQYQTWLQQLQ